VIQPPSLASLVLTESALSRYHSDTMRTVSFGPFPQLDSINAYNRFVVSRYTEFWCGETEMYVLFSVCRLDMLLSVTSASELFGLG
jgi:hypothetical protein